MEEQRTHISQGKAEAFLVCDRSLGDSDAPFFSWLRSEGFTFACYNWNYGCYWAHVSITRKQYAYGMPGACLVTPTGNHSITIDEFMTIYRIYEKKSGKIKADLICFADEVIDTEQDLLLFDPIETWKKTKLSGGTYTVREILVPVFKNGECIYKSPVLKEIAAYCRAEKDTLWDETKRLFYPHRVYVDLSKKLYDVKKSLLDQMNMTD